MSIRRAAALIGCVLMLSVAGASNAQVLISEIMYNPDSAENIPVQTEWVEIYNAGALSVDIGGWYIADEDGASSIGIPSGVMIAPKQAVVLFPQVTSLADFQAAWGSGFAAYAQDFEPLFGMANSPSASNEILTLRDSGGALVDQVNYDDASPWPSDSPDGPSIYLLPAFLDPTANDNGANWARSAVGVDGAYAVTVTSIYTGPEDVGSPGAVVPEPGSMVALGAGLIGMAGMLRRKA